MKQINNFEIKLVIYFILFAVFIFIGNAAYKANKIINKQSAEIAEHIENINSLERKINSMNIEMKKSAYSADVKLSYCEKKLTSLYKSCNPKNSCDMKYNKFGTIPQHVKGIAPIVCKDKNDVLWVSGEEWAFMCAPKP